MNNLKCFIASAFDHKDIDKIYDSIVKPTLKQLNIRPLRVDRINHNEKIDSKIIQLINESDFGIVDLTNARPSVYYEAGLLEGQNKKVIYICRNDHFKPDANDIHGILRVHFDLSTKNIIPWADYNSSFKKKLQLRINLVTKPLILELKKSNEEAISKTQFESLSINERIQLVHNRISKFAISKKFKPTFVKNYHYNLFAKKKSILKIEVQNSILKNDITFLAYRDKVNFLDFKSKNLIICSLSSFPRKRILHFLRLYHPISENSYRYENTTLILLESISSMYKLELLLKKINLK